MPVKAHSPDVASEAAVLDAAGGVEPVQLRPKAVTLRASEWNRLDELARRLHDSRSAKGQRITANTVIRIAIDGVMAHRRRLHGDTEAALATAWMTFLGRPGGAVPGLEGAEPLRGKKHVAIRPDQWTAVDVLARELQDARASKVERITANTVIRIAVDGLLEHNHVLRGDTEEELRRAWLDYLAKCGDQ